MNGSWKMIGSMLAAVVLVGSAAATVDQWAPWVKETEFRLVANDSYNGLIVQANQQIIDTERAIREAEGRLDWVLVDRLKQHLEGLKAKKTRYERRQQRLGQ